MVGELGSTFGKQECQTLYAYIYFVCIWPCCATSEILVPQPGMEPVSPVVKVQSPNHWTTREVLDIFSNHHNPTPIVNNFLILIFVYLAVVAPSCSTQNLKSYLQHVGSSFLKVRVTQSCLTFCGPWTIQSMEFSRPEYWNG